MAGTLGEPPTRSRQVKTLPPLIFALFYAGLRGDGVFTTPFTTRNHPGLGAAEGLIARRLSANAAPYHSYYMV